VKRVTPRTKVIGVEPVDSNAMYRSLKAGRRVTLPHVNLFADGVAVRQVGLETLRLTRALVDEIVLVDTDEICAAIKDIFEDTRTVLEPAGALSLAGAKRWLERRGAKGRTVVAVATGANMNFDRLRFVAERAELGEQREAVLAVTIPERPGSYKALCTLLGKRSVTEFNYRYAPGREAHIFLGVSVSGREETQRLIAMLRTKRRAGRGPFGQRDGEAPRAPPGGRARAPAGAGNALPLRVPRAARRAHEIPAAHGQRLEHLALPLPQSWRRRGARAGGNAGTGEGPRCVPAFPARSRLRLHRRIEEPGLQVLLEVDLVPPTSYLRSPTYFFGT
jgi:hypothetical protein